MDSIRSDKNYNHEFYLLGGVLENFVFHKADRPTDIDLLLVGGFKANGNLIFELLKAQRFNDSPYKSSNLTFRVSSLDHDEKEIRESITEGGVGLGGSTGISFYFAYAQTKRFSIQPSTKGSPIGKLFDLTFMYEDDFKKYGGEVDWS